MGERTPGYGAKLSVTDRRTILGPGTSTIGKVDQGAAGDEAWPVSDIDGGQEDTQEQILLELRLIRRLLEIRYHIEVKPEDL